MHTDRFSAILPLTSADFVGQSRAPRPENLACAGGFAMPFLSAKDQRAWRNAHVDELRAYHKSYYHSTHRWAIILKKYGMTREQFDAMLIAQSGRCAACEDRLPSVDRDIHIDHDHATGVVRGILCQACNKALGYVRDSPTRLLALVEYLHRSTAAIPPHVERGDAHGSVPAASQTP